MGSVEDERPAPFCEVEAAMVVQEGTKRKSVFGQWYDQMSCLYNRTPLFKVLLQIPPQLHRLIIHQGLMQTAANVPQAAQDARREVDCLHKVRMCSGLATATA